MSRKSRKNISAEILTIPFHRIRRAGLYVRLSNLNAGKVDDDSIETQTEYLRQSIAKYSDIIVEDIYADNGFTGRNFERPQFERLLSDIRSKRLDCVVVKDFSRLGRNFVETGYYIEKLFPFLDVRFIAINEHYDSDNPHCRGSLTVPIKDMLNEYYSKDISRKVKGTFDTKRQNGENIHVVPYGYQKDSEHPSKFAIDEATADFVRRMFEAYASGQSIGELTKRLNEIGAILPYWRRRELGLARPSDKVTRTHWITTDVVQILDNPVYTGNMVYNRFSYPNGYKKTPTVNPKSEWQVVENAHLPIISRELFAKAESRLEKYKMLWSERQTAREKRQTESPNCFNGILYCASCGKGLKVRKQRFGEGRLYQHFYCVNSQCTNRVNIAERLLRVRMMDEIRQKAGKAKQFATEQDVLSLQRQIADCKDKKRMLYEQMLDGKIDREEYLAEKDLLNQTECQSKRQILEHTDDEAVATEETRFSPALLKRLVLRIDVVSEREIKITYQTEESK